jgi:predicted HAD superfamily Cof-like phosphohydrolase
MKDFAEALRQKCFDIETEEIVRGIGSFYYGLSEEDRRKWDSQFKQGRTDAVDEVKEHFPSRGKPTCRFDELSVGAYFYNVAGAEPHTAGKKIEPVSDDLNPVLNVLNMWDGKLTCAPDEMIVQEIEVEEAMRSCAWLLAPQSKTTPHYDRVKKFMEHANQDTPDKPCVPDEETRVLRAKLSVEEVLETTLALGTCVRVRSSNGEMVEVNKDTVEIVPSIIRPDLEAIVDGFADISVVNAGMLIACGITDVAILQEVDKNNLAKFEHHCPECGKPGGPFVGGGKVPGDRHCQDCDVEFRSGYRRNDGKWIKPASHKPPAIGVLLEAQGWEAE